MNFCELNWFVILSESKFCIDLDICVYNVIEGSLFDSLYYFQLHFNKKEIYY